MNQKTKKIKANKNRKLQMFLVFLGLSLFFWTLTKLSKEYTHQVVFNTNYTDLTNDKIIQNKPLSEITTVLKTSGFNLLGYNMKTTDLSINLQQLQRKDEVFYYLTNNHLSDLQSQLSSDQEIVKIHPDTLFFDFGILKSKEVLIKPQLKINYKSGYNLINDIGVSPNKVTISGPDKVVDSIAVIETKLLELNEVTSDFEKDVQLEIPNYLKKVHFSTTKVTLNGKVEKFTQGDVIVNVNIVNVPDSLKLSTFSKKVKLSYKVSLANFGKVQASNFEVICDYSKTQKDSLSYLIPELKNKPNLVSDIVIIPSKLDFLIKR